VAKKNNNVLSLSDSNMLPVWFSSSYHKKNLAYSAVDTIVFSFQCLDLGFRR